jgi:Predicted dinucleotide-binding enzymes
MRIGIIGAGRIGGTLARHLVAAGNTVAVSNSRGPHTLRDLVAELGPNARAMTPTEAVRFGEVVIVSVPFGVYRELPTDGVDSKVVIDTTNYYPDRDGHIDALDAGRATSSELVQSHFGEDARVVKAFNTIYWNHLRDMGRPNGDPARLGVPISGDDPEAKYVVSTLADDIGFDAVDAGTLAEGGRKHQPGTPVYATDLHTNQVYAEVT